MRSNAYERCALFVYPTWNPLNTEVMDISTKPKFKDDPDKAKAKMLVIPTHDNHGVVFAMIW